MDRLGFNQFVLGSDAMTAARRGESFAALDAYVESGGTVLDTARVYGDSELVIAEWLRANDPTGQLQLITKGGHPDNDWLPRLTEAEIMRDAQASSRIFGDRVISCYLLHRDEADTPAASVATTLRRLIETGLCARVGVSNWSMGRVVELEEELSRQGGPHLSVVSNYYGLAVPSGPGSCPGVMSATPIQFTSASEFGYSILAWGALSAGYFTGRTDRVVAEFEGRENERRRAVLEETAAASGVPIARLLARWLSTVDPVLVPVVGTLKATHMTELLTAAADRGLDEAVAQMAEQLRTDCAAPTSLLLRSAPPW